MIPCALITSCMGLKPDDLVKAILRVNELPASNNVVENIVSYPWHVDTKYYTADINLCVTENRTIGNEDFAKSVEAVIITCDTTQTSSFDQVKMWLPYLKEIGSPVQLLVCERASDENAVGRRKLVGWCVDNAFELVELNPLQNDEGSDEDDFKESFGIPRIVEALSCHSWTNMIMKDKPSYRSPYFQQLMSDTAAANLKNSTSQNNNSAENGQREDGDKSSPKTSSPAETSLTSNGMTAADAAAPEAANSLLSSQQIIESWIPTETGVDDESEESFEKLFEKLQVMKEAASSLPPEERKEYAKRVTIQFWKAIGGSPDEIEGLSDSEEDL